MQPYVEKAAAALRVSRLQPWVFRLQTLCVQAGAAVLYADETCMLPSYHSLQVGAAAVHAG